MSTDGLRGKIFDDGAVVMRSPAGGARMMDAEAILETISDGFVALDRDWRFTYVNREAERLLGRRRSDLLDRNIWEVYPDLVASAFFTQYQRAAHVGEPVTFEEFFASGQRRFSVRAYPDDTHLTAYFREAPDQNSTGGSAERERLEGVLESVDVGIWYCDLPFAELTWNAKTKEHFWLPADAGVRIETFYERMHPDDRERTRQAIQAAIENQKHFDAEYRTMSGDGSAKWIRAIGRAFYDAGGRPVRFDGITVDITGQKQLLAKEQQSRTEAEMLNRIGRALSAELDLEKLVQMITNAATELTGAQFGAFFYNLTNSEGESYTLYTLCGVPRESFSSFPMPRKTEVFAPTFHGEAVVRSDDITKDERYGKNPPYHGMPEGHLPVRSYLAVPVVSRSGNVIGGLFFGHAQTGAFTEAHERIVVALASQAATAMDNAHLFIEVERAKREAQESASALAKSNEELQQVAYVAAHDLQEPLRTIASFTQLVERRYRGLTGGGADELVNSIVGSVRRMQILLDNVLEYTSLSSEDARPYAPVDMQRIADECLDELGPIIQELGASVRVSPLPIVEPGNPTQLKQLLLNLLNNALKYARAGVRPEIDVTSEHQGAGCAFTVRDNGQGFAPEYTKQIFRMFSRLHGREIPGTGIGLALCRRIVEVHGGSMWAESVPGAGTAMHFRLPCRANH